MNNRNQLYSAIRRALAAGVVASVASPFVYAAEGDDTYEGDRFTVTGSRILRTEVEGANPVTIITREDLDASGEISVADVLRQTTFNSFGSFREQSGFTAQSQASISLRGVGSSRTLVLLDGRRMAGSGNRAGGGIQNLNVIPFAAVERIEILRDGASAVYGSDAIGGVVNIIMRKDYEGLHFAVQIDKPTQDGGEANSGQIVMGVTSGRGNITIAVDHQERKIIFDNDRPFSSVGLSAFGFPGSFARVSTGGTFNIIAGDPDTGLTFSSDPRCPALLNSPGPFPNSQFNTSNGICNFNFAAISASAASLRRDSLFVNTNYELSDTVNFFARFISTNNKSFGRYAPAPFTAPFVSLDATNPNNPTAGEAGGPYDLTVLFRTVPIGPRDSTAYDTLFDVLVGLDGTFDWFGGFDWEFALQHSRTQIFTPGENYGIREFLQAAVDDGSLDLFHGVPNPNALNNIRHTIFQFAENRQFGGDITVNWDLIQTNSGPWPIAVGFEYMDERFTLSNDAQSDALNVFGTAGGSARGERARYAMFGELLIPLGSMFEVTTALRWDHYNDFGDSINPKVSAAFRPSDSWLLRGSYGKGFRAPDLSILNATQAQSFPGAVDSLGCFMTGQSSVDPGSLPPTHPCVTQQYETLFGGNPDLGPEESEQWNLGVVWSPTENISIGLDYYSIELTNQIANVSSQQVLNNELLAFQIGRPLNPTTEGSVTRGGNGRILLINAPALNLSGFKTSGVDLDFSWNFEVGNTGDWRWWVLGSHVEKFEVEPLAGVGFQEIGGLLGVPENRLNTGIDWSRGNWSGALQMNWIDSTSETASAGLPEIGHIASWTTWDIQLGYAFGWDGKLTLGVRNVDDRDPPVSNAFGHPRWSFINYDIFGRVPYIRYEQDL